MKSKVLLNLLMSLFLALCMESRSEVTDTLRPNLSQVQVNGFTDDPLLDETYRALIKDGYSVKYQKKQIGDNEYVLDGLVSLYTNEGKLVSLASYSKGFPDGMEVHWNESGQIVSQTMFKDGLKFGNVLVWSDQGVLLSRENFKDGKKDGEHHYWSNDGKILRIAYWDLGNLDKIAIYDKQENLTKILLGKDAKNYVRENFSTDIRTSEVPEKIEQSDEKRD